MSKFLSKRLSGLEAYVPGEQPQDRRYIKLNTNESPYPPKREITDEMSCIDIENLRLYSDPDCKALTEKLAEVYGVSEKNIVFGNGSDEILSFCFTAFCDSTTPAVFPDISYGFYKVFAELCCIDYKQIPLKSDFTINPDDYKSAGGTIFIANPNAPTGLALELSQIEEILKENRENVVVIDEAYVDFGAQSTVGLIEKYDNLIVVQTFSKSRSLAGARLGMAIASEQLICDIQKIRCSNNPYNINRLTQKIAYEVLCDEDYFKDCCKKIQKSRMFLTAGLVALGFEVIPSCTNFVFAKHNRISGMDFYKALKEKGILVRHFTQERICEYNRITVGTDKDVKALLRAADEILGGKL